MSRHRVIQPLSRFIFPWLVCVVLCILLVSAQAATFPKDTFSYSKTIADISATIAATMTEKQIVGLSIALVDQEDLVWSQGFGWADKSNGKKVTTDTTFHFGSVSKMLTTVAAMILVDEGKLDLDKPVKDYVPSFSLLSPEYKDITVRMFLNHQSGIPSLLPNWSFTTEPVPGYNQKLLKWLSGEYLQYPPGYCVVYCNNGFTLMEEVIQSITGQTFLGFVKERILEPLGMTSTGYDTDNADVLARLSKPYADGEEQPPEYVNLLGTGGFASTPSDMCRFLAMFIGKGTAFGQKILEPASVAAMCTDQTPRTTFPLKETAFFAPGLGWDYYSIPVMKYAGQASSKDGETMVYGSDILVMPEYHLGVAVTINSANSTTANSICQETMITALEDRYSLARPATYQVPAAATTTSIDTASLEGLYGSTKYNGFWDLHAVDARTISLTVIRGDYTAVISNNLTCRQNGWFFSDSYPTTGFSVEQEGGKTVLVAYVITGATVVSGVVGEKLGTPPTLSAAWAARKNTVWLTADLSPVFYNFDFIPMVVVLQEREGWLSAEYADYGLASSAKSSFLDASQPPLMKELEKNLTFKTTKGEHGAFTTCTSRVLEPLSDTLAWIPLQLDSRNLTHMQVEEVSGEEWLRYATTGTLLRPLKTVPLLAPGSLRTVALSPEMGQWFKLTDGVTYPAALTIVADSNVRWNLYTDQLLVVKSGWGSYHYEADSKRSDPNCCYLLLGTTEKSQATVEVLGESSQDNWHLMK